MSTSLYFQLSNLHILLKFIGLSLHFTLLISIKDTLNRNGEDLHECFPEIGFPTRSLNSEVFFKFAQFLGPASREMNLLLEYIYKFVPLSPHAPAAGICKPKSWTNPAGSTMKASPPVQYGGLLLAAGLRQALRHLSGIFWPGRPMGEGQI